MEDIKCSYILKILLIWVGVERKIHDWVVIVFVQKLQQ